MPRHNFEAPRGEIVHFALESEHLKGNLLGDPHVRNVWVYLPPGWRDGGEWPLLLDLAPFTGSGPKRLAWTAFGESVPQRIDRLVAEGRMGEVIVAFPDAFTRLGGNQYVDSAAMGNWDSFLVEDLLPALEARFPVKKGRDHRAVYGKSSGGYGALNQVMRHAGLWAAAACQSGDMGFEWLYLPEMPQLVRALEAHGGIEALLAKLDDAPKVRGSEMQLLSGLAMAASYDPDADAPFGIRLPVDLHTCELDGTRWARWLDQDPVRMVERPEVQSALRGLDGLWIDVGRRDQFNLHFGARRLHDTLIAAGVEHHYEEFDDDHLGIDYRLDASLPWLYARIA